MKEQNAPTVDRTAAITAADEYRKAQRRLEIIEGDISHKTAAVAAKYEEEIGVLRATQTKNKQILEAYVQANRDEVLEGKQSIGFAGVKIGFRKAAAKLALKGATTWDKVMKKLEDDRILANSKLWKAFVKEEVKLDKNALKKADSDVLKQLGLKVEQDENFFVKL